jgi:hypothetical protein
MYVRDLWYFKDNTSNPIGKFPLVIKYFDNACVMCCLKLAEISQVIVAGSFFDKKIILIWMWDISRNPLSKPFLMRKESMFGLHNI